MKFDKTMAGFSLVVSILLFKKFVDGFPTMYTFGKTCSLEPFQMNEESTFYLSFYNIDTPRNLWCSYTAFSGQGSNSKDKYKICTLPKTFSDPKCSFKLTLRNSLNGSALRTFSCTEYAKTTFCTKQGEDLFFVAEFYKTNKEIPSEFIFHVEATRTYDHLQMVAGVSCGAVGLVIIILVAIVIKCHKMKNNSTILRERFRTVKDVIFCQNSSPEREQNRGTGTCQQSCVITSNSRLSQAASQSFNSYIVSGVPTIDTTGSGIYVDPGLLYALHDRRSPPPYQEEENRAFDPPPEYSSLPT